MPFTFSHPAIILPLKYLPKKWFSLTSLVIGSLTPDFEYFLRMKVESNFSHTISGLFWFDLPLGLLLAYVFHDVIRNNFYDNLPMFLKTRLLKFKLFNWDNYFKENWLIVLISVLIGASSHLLWDSFTHTTGYFVEMIPTLKNSIVLFGKQIPVFKILQHGSSLFGGIAIVFAIFKMPRQLIISKKIDLKYWLIFLLLTSTIFLIRILLAKNLMIGDFIVTSISAAIISLVVTSLLFLKKINFVDLN